ncbi:MAG: hypothetical protein M3019_05020 [Candidatus Dormibacteraeota bacterium]|nr:hypothetical protein [Candidatus Dormibacteraeota bacterium]
MKNNRLYELAQMRENEYVAGLVHRGGERRGNRLIAGVTRRLRRDGTSTEG